MDRWFSFRRPTRRMRLCSGQRGHANQTHSGNKMKPLIRNEQLLNFVLHMIDTVLNQPETPEQHEELRRLAEMRDRLIMETVEGELK